MKSSLVASSSTSQIQQNADVIVLGAGLLGINTAYWLAREGFNVTVIDRQEDVAMETSYANGGQISVCHAEPWANPHAPWQVLKWLSNPEAPLLFRPQADIQQWKWLAQWLIECLPGKSQKNTEQIIQLALYSRQTLKALRQELNLNYKQTTQGILHFYRTQAGFNSAKPVSQFMQQLGCERQIISTQRVLELEPSLSHLEQEIVGGTYTPEDESGDAHLYCQALKKECESLGVEFKFDHQIKRIQSRHSKLHTVHTRSQDQNHQFHSKRIVVALGAFSTSLLRPLGISINVYPAKGYSVSIPIQDSNHAPRLSLTDDEHKLVISRLGNTLRVAGTAELNGYNTQLNQTRCEFIQSKAAYYFPQISDFEHCEYWAGLRPATPSSVPYVGESKVSGIWLNTGHGTLGWTMGCGSGKIVADAITKKIKSNIQFR